MRAFLVLLIVAAANAADLLRVRESVPGQYIIKIKSDIDVESVLPTVRLAGGNIRHTFKTVFHGFSAKLSDKVLDIVLNLPAVEYVEENGIARTQGVAASWGLDRIDQRNLPLDGLYDSEQRLGNGGEGVHVYVIDTGIQSNHQELAGRVHIENPLALANPEDCHGHGTHCAGIVAGSTYGVATGTHLCSVKVFGCTGYGTNDDIIFAVQWVAEHAEKPAFASMSFGSGKSDAVNDAVNNLVLSGVQTAVAAGNNDADACNYSPASAEGVVTVGATDKYDARSSFSNYGQCVDIFAPGTDITSAWYEHDSTTAINTISGTSMACPHVAGAFALYAVSEGQVEADDGLNTYAKLINSATQNKVTNPGDQSNNRLLYV